MKTINNLTLIVISFFTMMFMCFLLTSCGSGKIIAKNCVSANNDYWICDQTK